MKPETSSHAFSFSVLMFFEPQLPDYQSIEMPSHDLGPTSDCHQSKTQLSPKAQGTTRQRVLLLEDDPTMLSLLQLQLESLSIEASSATSIHAARRLLDEHQFELGIFDIHLPDGSGLELCTEIDEHPRLMGLPIIVLSSECDPQVVKRTRCAGGFFFLSKPYDPNVLLTLAERALGQEL